MHNPFRVGVLTALAVLTVSGAVAGEASLPLAEAVRIAVTVEDPSLLRFDARAEALEDRAVADAQFPDPMARVALVNVPTDTFRYDQEAMTQVQLGLRQEFPRGRTLELRGERRRAEAAAERARKELTLRRIVLAVRTTWFDRFYWTNAQVNVRQSREAVSELIEALAASFATGALTIQDVLRAELELSLLDDRLAELRQRAEHAEADLARFIGAAAVRPMPSTLPDLPQPASLQGIEARLVRHPAILVDDATIAAKLTDIELAEQAYKPSWALEGGYGLRGGGRADFTTIGVSVSIPLFTGNRQDRNLSAAVKERGAAKHDRSAQLLDLRRDLGRAYTDWTRLEDRVELYSTAIVARANETAEASITTYANRLTDFSELIRSQLAELDAELKRLELRTERAKAWAVLDYLAGESS
ncbi:MAG: TolC family protein [Proteobacteria bacterium]|nr:TolC family protein [Pseudomonadota bacterium]